MENELQGKLVEILTAIQTATGKAADFTMAQLPDIAQSYVAYGRASSLIWLAVWALCFGACLWIAVRKGFCSAALDKYGYWTEARTSAAVLGTMGALPSGLLLAFSFQRTALIWLAPKVWLLQELASLVK